ncbi:DNA-(apurinic or apyrimidinic site) lyase [Recurvomyces mirabilis]|uniref:Apurinic-apyrimidinic endonuclease 1 n=1 Tax=Recurvomyces mirabilis TaxID=574656 RepID=A0AAE1C148_9PEZI|nr:DNA-(apurinic or apyrimidinic site) lyase [Recurvomyces mirabilis]KAK5151323.1 DNA-(apurinic or apyrimidinic site) lyase [Recurvomyces mirabilis]
MPKRRAAVQEEAEESDLSPPPAGLLDVDATVVSTNGDVDKEPPTKKHKARQAAEVKSKKVKVEVKQEVKIEAEGEEAETAPKKRRKGKTEVKVEENAVDEDGNVVSKVKTKRKSKAEKERELVEMPLAARTIGHKLLIGAHVSASGGVQQAVLNSVHIGANAFALFLKSQRKWENPPLLEDQCKTWHSHCNEHKYDHTNHIVPHGSYLVNLAHTDKTRTDQAYTAFVDDLKRCERLGITLYNFHPGNDQNNNRPAAIAHLASNLNHAHAETKAVVTLLETMAHGGNTIGSTFEDLRDIIQLVDDKTRVGVCIDTCHIFAAGYDLRTPEAFKQCMDEFEKVVGFKYLRAMHLNDSKAPFASFKDLHANIGTGFLGLRAFHNVANEARFAGLPLVLETPIDVRDADGKLVKDERGKDKEDKGIWAREIKLLENLVGMNVESAEFLRLEEELARQGKPERERLLEQMGRVKEKKEKKVVAAEKRASKKKPVQKKDAKVDKEASSRESSPLSELEEGT